MPAYPEHVREELDRVAAKLTEIFERIAREQVGRPMDYARTQALRRAFADAVQKHMPPGVKWHLLLKEDHVRRSITVKCSSPEFQHDCDACEYLGRVDGGPIVDLYTCEKTSVRTFIARYGDEPQDYISSPSGITPMLSEAHRRWDDR